MSEYTFPGFEPANTTPVPDIFFDELLAELSAAELRALLYIFRRTWGFKKAVDAISFNQFIHGITTKEGKVLDKGCGISDRTTLKKALDSLEKMGCIESTKGKDPNGDNATTLYRIKFRSEVVVKPDHPGKKGSSKTRPPVVVKPDHPSSKTRPPVVVKPDQQETVIQLDSLQETVIQDEEGKSYVERPNTSTDHLPPSPSFFSVTSFSQEEETLKEKEAGGVASPLLTTDQERTFWSLWLNVDQNQKGHPELNEIAAGHIKELAPGITTQKQIESLVTFTRKKLSEQHKREIWKVALGNLRSHVAEWDHEMQKEKEESKKEPSYFSIQTASDDKIVWYTKFPESMVDGVLNSWYLFERATMGEVRKHERFIVPPTIDWLHLGNKYKKYQAGKIQLPPDVRPDAPAMQIVRDAG